MTSTPQKISFKDIRKGDTIRVIDTQEFKVTRVGSDEEVHAMGGVVVDRLGKARRVFELVDRPIPPLPTEYGSLIEVDGERWFLRESDAYITGMWQGTGGQHDRATQMKMEGYVKERGGFTVIA